LCFRMIISAEVSGMKQEWRSEQLGSYWILSLAPHPGKVVKQGSNGRGIKENSEVYWATQSVEFSYVSGMRKA
jgi:hypothetical protein